jgi:diphthine synthase
MVLVLIGLGISDDSDITVRGLNELLDCNEVYAEAYTNRMAEGTLNRLEAKVRRRITVLSRADVESEKRLVEAAKERKVALLVPGDPLIATTHVSLVVACRKAGVKVKVVHSSSILSAAIGEAGLQSYKFGKMVTLPYWRENYKPVSTYEVICENLSRGLHTLVLLDIDEQMGPMEPKQALALLLEMKKEAERAGKREAGINEGSRVVVLSKLGHVDQKISYGKIKDLMNEVLGEPPCCIIVPAKLHFLEEEFLDYFKI